MAKHGSRRKFRKYLKGQIDHDMDLGTLSGQTVISEPIADTLSEQAYLTSVKCAWALDNFTSSTNDGPILVGVAHSDYTSAEIEAWVENANSWESSDLIGQEIAKRRIRRVGILRGPATSALTSRLNEGKMITTKCGWMLNTGQTVRIWAYNMGAGNLDTTDPVVHTEGHANLWPR